MSVDDQRTSCPGFLDEYGIWNNGFECPPLANQIRICCGSDSRRYCCTLATIGPSLTTTHRRKLNTIKTTSSFIDKIHSTRFTLPILFSCLLILILFIISIVIWIFLCYCSRRRRRHHHQQQRRKRQEDKSIEDQQSVAGKQTLLVDHFPFSPPHHQFFYNDVHHPTTRDTLTTNLVPSTINSTSSASTSSVRIPSDIYFHDWKEFFVTNDQQSLNIYPPISSHQNTLNKDSFHFHNYSDQDDIIV